MFLKQKPERLGEYECKGGKTDRERQAHHLIRPLSRAKHRRCSSQTPGHPRGDKVRATVGMHCKFMFAVFHALQSFRSAGTDEFGIQFAKQPEAASIGMSSHGDLRTFAGEHVNGRVFQAVVAADAGEGGNF